jgi:hypothetical protein
MGFGDSIPERLRQQLQFILERRARASATEAEAEYYADHSCDTSSFAFEAVVPARVPRHRPTNAESWEIPFSREGVAFLGEKAQLKVRDARSISPSGLELE